jgi:hypothetical protein
MPKWFAVLFLLSVFSCSGLRQLSAQTRNWVPCADEGKDCYIAPGSGTVLVRYGDGQKFFVNEYQNVRAPVACSNVEFGDPAWGQDKHCSYRQVPTLDSSTFRKCSDESQHCGVSTSEDTPVDFFFGTPNQWVHKYYSRYAGDCSPHDFFWDPSPGNPKTCSFFSPAFPRPTEWRTCATEGQTCTIGNTIGTVLIRYGVKGKNWFYRLVAADSIVCNNETFRTGDSGIMAKFADPDPADTKFCDILPLPTIMDVFGRWHLVTSMGGKGTISHMVSTSITGSRQNTHSTSYSVEVAVEMSREWKLAGDGKFGAKISTKFGTTDVTSVSDTITRQTTNSTTATCPAGSSSSQLWQWGVDVDEMCFAQGTCKSQIETIKYLCVADPPAGYTPTVSPSLCADNLCLVERK